MLTPAGLLLGPTIDPLRGASHSMVVPDARVPVEKVCIAPLQPVAGPTTLTEGKGFTVMTRDLSTVQPFTLVSRKSSVSRPAVLHRTVICDEVVSPVVTKPSRGLVQRYTLPGVVLEIAYTELSPAHRLCVPLMFVVGDA